VRGVDLLEENVEFDDNTLDASIDKFKIPLPPRSIMMLGCLLKNMKKVKKPNANMLVLRRNQSRLHDRCRDKVTYVCNRCKCGRLCVIGCLPFLCRCFIYIGSSSHVRRKSNLYSFLSGFPYKLDHLFFP
jgi:hypothetical protein